MGLRSKSNLCPSVLNFSRISSVSACPESRSTLQFGQLLRTWIASSIPDSTCIQMSVTSKSGACVREAAKASNGSVNDSTMKPCQRRIMATVLAIICSSSTTKIRCLSLNACLCEWDNPAPRSRSREGPERCSRPPLSLEAESGSRAAFSSRTFPARKLQSPQAAVSPDPSFKIPLHMPEGTPAVLRQVQR